jgi:hypothetical protein
MDTNHGYGMKPGVIVDLNIKVEWKNKIFL